MQLPLDPQEFRADARRYREQALSASTPAIREEFEGLALAYDELADLLGANDAQVGQVPSAPGTGGA
jgi:hypothetical protein